MAGWTVPRTRQRAAPRRRFAVLSHILPPAPSGQAIVLYRLLRDLPAESYCLLSADPCAGDDSRAGTLAQALASERLHARYWHLVGAFQRDYDARWQRRLVHKGYRLPRSLIIRSCHIRTVLKRQSCRALVACSGDLLDIPAGFLAARSLGIAFFAYMFDDYARQWIDTDSQIFAKIFWRALARHCTGVIVPNETLQADYRCRYGIETAVIHNPAEDPVSWDRDALPKTLGRDDLRIAYTGAIYDAHFDAFHNLLIALQGISTPRIRLHVYSSYVPADPQAKGLTGPVVYHPPVSLDQAIQLQHQADFLFLPLAFHSPYPDIVRTSAPGKLGELLASGRPVLVHAPADAFVSQYCRRHNCAQVVDRDDPEALVRGIRQLLENPDLRARLTFNAQTRARHDFSRKVAQERFLKLVAGRASVSNQQAERREIKAPPGFEPGVANLQFA